jgi:hypothetical protein
MEHIIHIAIGISGSLILTEVIYRLLFCNRKWPERLKTLLHLKRPDMDTVFSNTPEISEVLFQSDIETEPLNFLPEYTRKRKRNKAAPDEFGRRGNF